MSKPPDNVIKLSETLTLWEYKSGGNKGFWLYDNTRGMNLSIKAKTERDAFIEALMCYQKRLEDVEKKYHEIHTEVFKFVDKFT